MEITNLKEKWGIRIEATAQEVLSLSSDFLRNLGYEKHFILFKGLGKISESEIYRLLRKII